MSRSANPIAVGAFVLGTLLLGALLLVFLVGGNWFSDHERYTLIYESSIKGLNVGAPVTIKGVKIGQVEEIKARMPENSLAVYNSVVVEIDPHALQRDGGGTRGDALVDELVKRGLRAQLRLQSLLTGLLYVDVDFHPDKPAVYADVKTRYRQIPTIPTDLEQLTHDLESIDVNKLGENLQQIVTGMNNLINDPALQRLGSDVQQTLAAVRSAADTLRVQSVQLQGQLKPLISRGDTVLAGLQQTMPQLTEKLDATLTALQQSSASLRQTSANTAFLTSEDSPLLYQINTAAANVNAAAAQVQHLTDLLERQPEALLYGKPEGK